MKWTYILSQKIKIALALLTVFLLVITTNILDNKRYSALQNHSTSVYEDRLMAENYLFHLLKHLKDKRQSLNEAETRYNPQTFIDDSIREIIVNYEATKLTREESEYFKLFKDNLADLNLLEHKLENSVNSAEFNLLVSKLKLHYEKIWNNLESLSNIQVTEGNRLTTSSTRILSSSSLNSKLEIGVLIIIGIIIQILIFSSKSIQPKFYQNSNLN